MKSFGTATANALLAIRERSRVTFIYRQEAGKTVKVALFYNRRFQRPSRNLLTWEGSYTAAFDPDYSIAVTVTEGAVVQKHWLHFDAKYRLEPAEVAQLLHDSSEDMMADGEAAIVIALRQGDPSFAPLALDEGLRRLPLGIQRAEVLFQAFLRGLAGVDGAAQASREDFPFRIILPHDAAPSAFCRSARRRPGRSSGCR